MRTGTFWSRLVRGNRWTWFDERYRKFLPAGWEATVMTLPADDQHHAKQGRSTGRVRFHSASGTLSVYLKRHYQLGWPARLGALIHPQGLHSPAAAEWSGLERARALGVSVPDPVAAGERIGPWGELQSFLMVAELAGCQALNEALPALASALDPAAFDSLKRELIAEMAQMTARLHGAYLFHKDLYLCHFFLDLTPAARPGKRLSLIDLHRLSRHPFQAVGWRNKDMGELLYSTLTLQEITDRDRLRFWMHYKRNVRMALPRFQLFLIRLKGRFYRWHNQGRFESSLKT